MPTYSPDRKLERGAAGGGQDTEVVAAGTAELGTAKPIQRPNTGGYPRVAGTLPPAKWRVKRNLPGPQAGACAAEQTGPLAPAMRAPPCQQAGRIGDGQVMQSGFAASAAERVGGPLARRVPRGGIGRVRRRAEAWRGGREAEIIEELPDDRRALNHDDHLHRAPAVGTEERIRLVDLAEEAGPSRLSSTRAGAADFQGQYPHLSNE